MNSSQEDTTTHPARGYGELLRRPGFAALLGAQALAVFDDNTFRQLLALFIAAHVASLEKRSLLISAATGAFVLPYILLSAYAGQVADRFSKRHVIITMKVVESFLLVGAAAAMYIGHITGMLAMLFLLGIHSAFLDPAKEGILPQLFPEHDLPLANGLMQLTIYSMIVLGPVAGGFLLDAFPARPYIPVAMLVGMALTGLALALRIARVPPIGAQEKFRWNPLGEFWHDFGEIRASKPLLLTVLAIAYFWLLGAVYLQNVVGYGHDLLHLGNAGISVLTAAVSVGIGLGAFTAGKLSGEQVELGLVPIGSIGLGVFGVALYFAHHSFALALAGHFLVGLSGGIFIIPLQSFLQARAGEHSKGRVIAASNVLTFTGVLLGAGLFELLSGPLHLAPHQVLLVMATLSFAVTAHILTVLPDFMIRLSFFLLTHSVYRIRVRGRENLPRRGPALLVSNHVSFIDPLLVGASTQRFIRFLMYRSFYERPGLHWFAKLMGAIPIAEEDRPRQVVESLRAAQARLREGELVCIFAEGAITRTGNLLRFHRGFEHILRGMDVPVIPVHLDGVWGSIFSYERGKFFFKWPRRLPYPLTVSIGAPLASNATAFEVRQAVLKLSAEAFAQRDVTQRPLAESFIDSAKRHWRRPALADSLGKELTFGRSLVGAMLFRRLIRRRHRGEEMIGVLLPPMVPSALLNAGITLAGSVPVNLNYTAGPEALAAAIECCELKTIFTSPKLLARLGIAPRPEMVMIEDVAQEFTRRLKIVYAVAARLLPRSLLRWWLVPRGVGLDSLATVIFSSGSTGQPKGVMLSQRNIVSNVEGSRQAIRIKPDDCLLGILPFFHSFGFTVGLWLPLLSGCSVAFHTNPLEARKVGELCRQHRVTVLISTPSFAWKYVQVCAREDFARLRMAIVGAEKMKPALGRAFEEKFGVPMFEGYGCTELSPVVAVGAPNYHGPDRVQVGHKPGSVGHPIPGVAVQVVHPDTLQELAPGQEGMLLARGPGVMLGYLGDPERTRQAITDGGAYITGDIARLDEDGFITITDRLSRFSKIAGEMVPHVRIEDALHQTLGGSEVRLVVTSVPDEQKGEKLAVLYTDLGVEVEELLRRLRESDLPKLWIPRKESFFKVDSLPVLGTGKLDLKRIKDTARRFSSTAPPSTPL